MKTAYALFVAFIATATASCNASPINSFEDQSADYEMSSCSFAVITESAVAASTTIKLVPAGRPKGVVALSLEARGPEHWDGTIGIELLDASGPLCSIRFSANGIEPCGSFLVEGTATFRVTVNPGPGAPHGVRLTLMSSEE